MPATALPGSGMHIEYGGDGSAQWVADAPSPAWGSPQFDAMLLQQVGGDQQKFAQLKAQLQAAQDQYDASTKNSELGNQISFITAMLGGAAGGAAGAGGEVAGAGAGSAGGGAATDATLNSAINAGNAGVSYAAPSYETAAGIGGGGGAVGGGATGLTPEVAKMLTQLGITGAGAVGAGGAGGAGSGGVPSNILSLLGPLLGIGGGISALAGGGQVGGGGTPVYNPTGLPQADSTLQQLLQTIYTQSADPQKALYDRTLQQSLDTGRAGQAARGLGVSPVGQQLENQQTNNFNIDWQNNALARATQGLPGFQNYLQTGANAQTMGNQANLGNATFNANQQRQGVAGLTTGFSQLGTLANQPGSWLNTLFSGAGGGGGTGGGAPVGGNNDVNAYPTFSY